MLLYIVRHGETNFNATGKLQGMVDAPLNQNGIDLAILTGLAIGDVEFDLAISSPLVRSLDTAKLILGENPKKDVKILVDDRIREISFGSWEGLGCTSQNFEIPSANFNLFTDPFSFQNAEDGESIQQVLQRTGSFYQELINTPAYKDKTILISTHGCAMRGILNQVYEDKENFWHGKVPHNCTVNIVSVINGVSKLIADDMIYYDESLSNNLYKPVD